ncbi:HNH endonuclease signature motif containing protein [Stigmatella sp. ncwal1]|uniref:HNH endonuclease signature motif containing protein n=1 Tax=Stigmatella ashevillensis TaxID=2995309 RepID=A0ABT5D505_9BACT|nr:HNH endonuclease signature motif containing protein [Stigmatella ashevillena]MDC0708743.1 HNH endonuclease signature motif containing protein [Stigmatella ashevillena]
MNRGTKPTRTGNRNTEGQIQVEGYGYWRPSLVQRLGEYCSYCEVPLGVNLAVEHKNPKSNPSVDPDDWGNLLLACTNCNSHKLDFGAQSGEILRRMFFPDTGSYKFSMVSYAREVKTRKQLFADGLLAKKPAANDNESFDCVWIKPNVVSAENKVKLLQTITLMGLNISATEEKDPKMSDRRVLNRTAAWERATRLAGLLSAHLPPSWFFDPLRNQIREAAIATGFWSVWVTVFQNTLPASPEKAAWMTSLFGAGAFPGTQHTF